MSSRKEKKKRRISNKKKFLLCLILIIIAVGAYFAYNNLFKQEEATAPKVVDEIKNFNYVVNENDTKLFKTTFKELKEILNKKKVDNKKYAEVISKLFVIDFFNLNNKTSKNDVGGVQFVYSSYKTDFVDYARDGMYKQVENKIDNKKNQHLPEVTSVEVTKVEEVVPANIFEHEDLENDTEADGYEVTITWKYKNGEGFQNKAVLTVVKDGDKLSIAKMEE